MSSSFENEFNRLVNNVSTDTLKQTRKIILNGFLKGLRAVDPRSIIQNTVSVRKLKDNTSVSEFKYQLEIKKVGSQSQNPEIIDLSKFSKALIIGGGKATAPMASALIEIIGPALDFYGFINIPNGQHWGTKISFKTTREKESSISVNYASHPIPNQAGFDGTRKMIELAQASQKDTLVFVLISGGGSALMPCPIKSISLQEKQSVSNILLMSNASINEINTIRKHISVFKGGNLARILYPKRVISLIISDVIGDPLDVIASGPTVPDSSTFADAWNIIKSHGLEKEGILPKSVITAIQDGLRGIISETPKKDDPVFTNVSNIIIGSVADAKEALIQYLESNGIKDLKNINETIELPIMKGEAVKYGHDLAEKILNIDSLVLKDTRIEKSKSYYLVNTGEYTVSIHGKGMGGRNQEMLLGCLDRLQTIKLNNIDFITISMAFDGIEGNSPATGAIIDSESISKFVKSNLDPKLYLENNDSYSFFKKIGDAMEIGQTQTNTNDMCCVIVTVKQK